jgi:G6PDH family F420-dependent oxidoreductase
MYPGRFWLALGSGENLNEHITGDPWPSEGDRDRRLLECADIIRRLLKGEEVTYRGLVVADRARLYVRPTIPPLLFGAALSVETAAQTAQWADGLITAAAGSMEETRRVVDAFRQSGGDGKPVYVQLAVSFAPSEGEALQAAHDQWRHSVLDGDALADLALPRDFDAATASTKPEELRSTIRISADLTEHRAWINEFEALEVDAVYVHNVHTDQASFITAYGEDVLSR